MWYGEERGAVTVGKHTIRLPLQSLRESDGRSRGLGRLDGACRRTMDAAGARAASTEPAGEGWMLLGLKVNLTNVRALRIRPSVQQVSLP